MGGMKGKMLGQQVERIHEEFLECIKVFTESQYDALDPMCKVSSEHKSSLNIVCSGRCIIYTYHVKI